MLILDTKAGYILDTFVAATAIYKIIQSWNSITDRYSTNKALLLFCILNSIITAADLSSLSNASSLAFMLSELSLSACSLLISKSLSKLHIWSVFLLHVLFSARLVFVGSSMSIIATLASLLVHTFSAWLTLDIGTRTTIKFHFYELFALRGYSLLKNAMDRELKEKDMVSSMEKLQFLQKIKPTNISNSKRFSLWRYTLSEEWISIISIITGKALVNIIKQGRHLIYIAIISSMESSHTLNQKSVIVLFAVWQAMAIADVFNNYLDNNNNRLNDRLRSRLVAKLIQTVANSKVKKPCHDSSIYRAWSIADGSTMSINLLSILVSQIFNLWIIANRVGIYFLIPLVTIAAHCFLDILFKYRKEQSIKQKRISKSPKYYENHRNVISNLRPIKFYAWDKLFANNIKINFDVLGEVPFVWRLLSFVMSLVGSAMSQIASATTVYAYIYMTGASISYSEIILLTDSTDHVNDFTNWLSRNYNYMVEIHNDYKAALKILDPDNNNYIKHNSEPILNKKAINLDKAVFSWGDDKFTLEPVSLQINAGKFVAVVGKIGSGKTSLLEAIAAEMPIIEGLGEVYGKLAYVTQKPYIQNATFRENILMTSEYNKKLFNRVVKACALEEDVKQFPAGDLTEIGYNGINLSGGQKVRLAIARALYTQADIYLFDDILSAVDANVERQLVENVLSNNGIIGNKTRVLVTHADHVVPLCDKVITLVNGQVDINTQQPIHFVDNKAINQMPNLSKTDSNVSTTELSKLTDSTSDKKSGKYIIDPEEGKTGFRLKHILWFINHSGYFAIGSLVVIKLLNSCLVYYLQTMRFDIMNGFNKFTTLDTLKQYLVLSAILKIADAQILIFEDWALDKFWTNKVSQNLTNLFITSVLKMKLPLAERLSESKLKLVLRSLESTIPIRLPLIMYTNLFTSIVDTILLFIYLSKLSLWLLIVTGVFVLVCMHTEKAQSRLYNSMQKVSNDHYINSSNKNVQILGTDGKYVRIHGITDRYMEKLYNSALLHYCVRYMQDTANFYMKNVKVIPVELINGIILGLNIGSILKSSNNSIMLGSVDIAKSALLKVQHNIMMIDGGIEALKLNAKEIATAFIYCEELEYEAPAIIKDLQLKSDWPSKGTIEFIDYRMRYRPELDIILDGLSFSVKRHEKVGIVGRTGAGKSSITYALMRLVESESGCIKIDGIDISTIGLYDLRSKITIIPQDPVLFEGTIRDNLDPEQKYTDKEVWEAIQACQINELLNVPTGKYIYNPEDDDDDDDSNGPWVEGIGLDKWIKPGSETFSVGQAQLVSLCRALLWKCKIIVLDEATANVDSKTDKIIQTVIKEKFTKCTVLTIAHRLNTIMDSDRILVLDHGQVKEFDSPLNLLANKNSQFSKLVESMKLSQATLNG